MGANCPRCKLPAARSHRSDEACIAALGAALAAMKLDLDELKADLAARRARDAARNEVPPHPESGG